MGYDNTPAPEKRGFFFFHENSAYVATDDCWAVHDAMVYWCLGCLDRPDLTSTGPDVLSQHRGIKANIYPNPASEKVHLTLYVENACTYEIQVLDLVGKELSNRIIGSPGRNEFEIMLEKQGFHFIRIVRTVDHQELVFKVISQ